MIEVQKAKVDDVVIDNIHIWSLQEVSNTTTMKTRSVRHIIWRNEIVSDNHVIYKRPYFSLP